MCGCEKWAAVNCCICLVIKLIKNWWMNSRRKTTVRKIIVLMLLNLMKKQDYTVPWLGPYASSLIQLRVAYEHQYISINFCICKLCEFQLTDSSKKAKRPTRVSNLHHFFASNLANIKRKSLIAYLWSSNCALLFLTKPMQAAFRLRLTNNVTENGCSNAQF